MSNLDLQKGRRQALAVLLGQVLLGRIVAIACLAGWGTRAAASAATGAAIGIKRKYLYFGLLGCILGVNIFT